MKVIIVNTPKGQFSIPLSKVAENKCDEYNSDRNSFEYQSMLEYVLNDDFDGIDWMINNTNWEDWQDIATKINSIVKVTESDFWTSSDDFEIKETK
jgi:hypothetical protein